MLQVSENVKKDNFMLYNPIIFDIMEVPQPYIFYSDITSGKGEKIMKKDLLFVTVGDSGKDFFFIPEQQKKTGRPLERVNLYHANKESDGNILTDYFASYIDREAPRFVLRALKTVYANQWNKKIEDLMIECFKLWNAKLTINECKVLFADDVAENIGSYIPTSANNNIEKMYAEDHITRVIKEHTYAMKKDDKGVSHKIEVIPFYTVEKTTYGKVIEREEVQSLNLDVNDLVQEASLAMIELVKSGLVNSPADMFECRSYIYKKINRYIMNERSKTTNEVPYVRTVDKDGEEHIFTEKTFVDRRLAKIDKQSVIADIEKALVKSLSKRTNKKNVLFTFRYVLLSGHSKVECASVLKIDEKQIRRYMVLIKKALNSAEVYMLLNEYIN